VEFAMLIEDGFWVWLELYVSAVAIPRAPGIQVKADGLLMNLFA
jgi:hypothetical protein